MIRTQASAYRTAFRGRPPLIKSARGPPVVLVRHTLAVALVIALVLPAMGQPRTVSADAVIGNGVSMVYELPKKLVTKHLRKCLCGPGLRIIDETSELICQSVKRVIKPSPLFFLASDTVERATTWARVAGVSNDPLAPVTKVTIGVILERDDKRLSSSARHFFAPVEHVRSVWDRLEALSESHSASPQPGQS
jgi:hypothetical protein